MYYSKTLFANDLQKCFETIVGVEALKNKRILVTGATGLIGSFLIDELMYLNENYDYNITVYANARNQRKFSDRFISHVQKRELVFVVGDVTKELMLDEEVDYVVHAAGDGFPAAFRDHPFETMTPAVVGTVNLLEYANKHNAKRFLFVSSGEVYGSKSNDKKPFREEEIGMCDSMSARSCYPNAKVCAETLCTSFYAEYGMECLVARLSHTYGACVSSNDNRATVQFTQNAINGEAIVMKSKGQQIRSYTYVVDTVAGLLTVLLSGSAGEAYNVANTHSRVSIADFARELAQIAGTDVVFEVPDENATKELTPIEYAVLDSSKLEKLGWKANYNIKQGVSAMYQILSRGE